MPYVSNAQRRFFHSPGAKKAGITTSQVKEFDSASKGKKLPEQLGNARRKSAGKRATKPHMKRMGGHGNPFSNDKI